MANSNNDDLYLDGLFSQFDVLSSIVAASTYGARPKTKKQKKFNKEDGLIMLDWLNTRKDLVNRTDQTFGRYFQRLQCKQELRITSH